MMNDWPVGTGVQEISKLAIPALTSWTFSGSPGDAVSKHQKSLQQTWLFHAFRYPSRPLQIYIRVFTVTAQCPARARGTLSSEDSWPSSSQVFVSRSNSAQFLRKQRIDKNIYRGWVMLKYCYISILSHWSTDLVYLKIPVAPNLRRQTF